MIIDKSCVQQVKLYMLRSFLTSSRNHFQPTKRLLTFEETFLGVEGNEYLGSITLSSSSGYPYKFLKKQPSKKAYFGTFDNPKGFDHKDMLFIRSEFDKTLENLNKGIRMSPIAIEELKIERRSLDKIDNVKTRVFNMSNMVQICVGKALFGQFVSKIMNDRIINGSSIGINNATEFNMLKMYLNEVGNNIIAGDYTNYDGTLPPALCKMVADVVNYWYNDEWNLARITFIHDLIYSYRVRGKNVFQVLTGQPSGNYLTTIINTFVNIAAVCYCYLKIAPPSHNSITKFSSNVRMNAFGDDNLISVSDEIRDWFNMQTLTIAFKEFLGMTYTDETKTSTTIPYKPLSACKYLQCNFVYNERDNMVVGVRDPDKIVETLYWIQSTSQSLEEQLFDNVEVVTQEYTRYSREEYQLFVDKLTEVLLEKDLAVLLTAIQPYDNPSQSDILAQRYKCNIKIDPNLFTRINLN